MSEMIDSNTMKYKLINLYVQNKEVLQKGLPDVVNDCRKEAIRNFDVKGLPSKGAEFYKYTDLMQAFGHQFGYAFDAPKSEVDPNTIFQCTVPNLDTYNVILENGWFYHGNNAGEDLPKEIVVTSFREAANKYSALFEEHYNKYAAEHANTTSSLNTAFAQDGLFMYIPDNVVLEKPIQVINLLRGDQNQLVNQRNLIIAGKNSQAKIVVCDHTLSQVVYLANTVTEVFVDENATFDLYNLQNQHNTSSQISSTYVHQKKYSNSLLNTLTLHGGFVRNNVHVKLAEEYAEANLYGLVVGDHKQHIDNYTFVDHAVPNCVSNELYKSIMDDDATGAFNGRILVRQDAQKTLAFQNNRNVLLTDTARFFTKPQLEIYADDVKCSHGATVGQIDEEALFYLKARGIGGKEAQLMLMYAFAHEVISNIRVPVLAERYTELVNRRLRGEWSHCEGCFAHCN